MLVLELVLKNAWKMMNILSLDTRKQWLRMGEVAFFKVSSVFKKRENCFRN